MLSIQSMFKIMLGLFSILTILLSAIGSFLVKLLFIASGILLLVLGMVMYIVCLFKKYDVRDVLNDESSKVIVGYVKVMMMAGMTFKRALFIYSRNTNKLRLTLYWLIPIMLLLVTTNVLFIVSGIGMINWINMLSMYSVVAVMLVFGAYRYQYLSKQMKGRPCLAGY